MSAPCTLSHFCHEAKVFKPIDLSIERFSYAKNRANYAFLA